MKDAHLGRACAAGHGQSLPPEAMVRLLGEEKTRQLVARVLRSPAGPLTCSSCQRKMRALQAPTKGAPVEVDACAQCGTFWLDAGESDTLRKGSGGFPFDFLKRLLDGQDLR